MSLRLRINLIAAGTIALLKSLRDSPVRLEVPVLTESLAAVRQLRAREPS